MSGLQKKRYGLLCAVLAGIIKTTNWQKVVDEARERSEVKPAAPRELKAADAAGPTADDDERSPP